MNKKRQLLGAHMFTSGGLIKAIDAAEKLNFSAIQIFTKNNNRWEAPPIPNRIAEDFKSKIKESGIKFICAHSSYLINLCAKDKTLLKKSRIALIDELNRCELLGIENLVFHPGQHLGQGREEGVKIVAESLNIAADATRKYKVNLTIETTAGQGTSIGHSFELLGKILYNAECKKRIDFCADTAHIFAAGYNISDRKEYLKTFKEFDVFLGLDKLRIFHLNDSKKELGSKVDRHEHIGKGLIGVGGFKNILNDLRFITIPKILETPKGKDQKEDIKNINTLKRLIT